MSKTKAKSIYGHEIVKLIKETQMLQVLLELAPRPEQRILLTILLRKGCSCRLHIDLEGTECYKFEFTTLEILHSKDFM